MEAQFQGAALAFQKSLVQHQLLILAVVACTSCSACCMRAPSTDHFVHAALGGVGALLALMVAGLELDVIAIIGIVLLIGIVKKTPS